MSVIPRPAHTISRGNISPNAVSVLYRLHRAGFRACLVGGGVRDLLLGRLPKDFDVATDAQPEQIYHLFRNCRLIGRRFRLAHIHFGSEIIEVATFRAASNGESSALKHAANGRILSDNVYGNIEEDAGRRDFTINALYYDIADFSVLDYVGGMADLQAGVLRLIGDPVQRYHEDPVRMLRAVRFQAKLGLRLDAASAAPLYELGHLLRQIPPARLGDEVLKLFLAGHAQQTLELLRQYRLFGWLFPATENCLQQRSADAPASIVTAALRALDQRVADGKSVSPGFLGAALLWEPFCEQERRLCAQGMEAHTAAQAAIERIIRSQTAHASLPGRGNTLREIWEMQPRLAQISGKRPLRLLDHPRFAAAYDFLLLRQDAEAKQLALWWNKFAQADDAARLAMTTPPKKTKAKTAKVRRSRKPRTTSNATLLTPAPEV